VKTAAKQAVRSAAIYARISVDIEGKSLGVQRQLEDCRKLAADRGWPVGAEYVDNDVSACSGKPRREYARMLADLESGARDAVIVYNLDRLHRRPVELEEFVALCERTSDLPVLAHEDSAHALVPPTARGPPVTRVYRHRRCCLPRRSTVSAPQTP